MRRLGRLIGLLLAVLLAFGIGFAWPILFRAPLVAGQDAVSGGLTAEVPVTIEDVGGRALVARPPEGVTESDVLVVIYPGGLVRPQAYEWLARQQAAVGRVAVIPEVPFDLAVLATARADAVIDRYGRGKQVVLIGHSLGGAMAAQFIADRAEQGRSPVAGLVLLAAYPPDGADLSSTDLAAISLRAEHDGVAEPEDVEAGMSRLPPGSELVVIDGAVHSFFGRYGPQPGDGVPTVSRAVAETQIVAVLNEFIAGLAD